MSPSKDSPRQKTPVYFVSHGGPNTMYETEHPVYEQLQNLGKEITQKIKPKAIVVFSAHWQSGLSLNKSIEINTSKSEPLLYDFYGFPRHYYQAKFPNVGSAEVAGEVMDCLESTGFKGQGTERGLDHGVFVPFKIMFDPEKNPLNCPIVQVSLLGDEYENDASLHIQLGKSVEKLREDGILIIASGMAVHNLRHFIFMRQTGGGADFRGKKGMDYADSFDEAIRSAIEDHSPGKERDEALCGLLKRDDSRLAHPTFEHLLPIHVAVGAAGDDRGKRLWTMTEGAFSWAQYRFGDV